MDEINDELRRILKVGYHQNRRVPVGLEQTVKRRADMAEVALVQDNFDVMVSFGDFAQNGHCLISRAVVDEEVGVVVLRGVLRHHCFDLLIKRAHIAFLVVAGGHYKDVFHASLVK